jgi:hypothetical protein
LYSGRISFQMNMLNLSSEQTTNIVTKGAWSYSVKLVHFCRTKIILVHVQKT